jgi:hypothetical protein
MPETPNPSTDKALRGALAVTGWPDDLGVAEPSQPSETARPAGLRWLPAGESVVLARATLGGRRLRMLTVLLATPPRSSPLGMPSFR